MPRLAKTRLTDTLIEDAIVREKTYEIRDSGQLGLVLRIYPTGNKRFIVQYNANTRKTLGDASLIKVASARIRTRKLLSEFEGGSTPRRESTLTLKSYLEGDFSKWTTAKTRYGKRDTKRLVSALGQLGSVRLDHLSQARIDRWFADRDVAAATKNRELAQLKSALNRAMEWSLINESPARLVKPIRDDVSKRVRHLSEKERKRLYKAMDKSDVDYMVAMVKLVLNTGLRRGEVFALEWPDIDLNTKQLHVRSEVSKTGKRRHIPLNTNAVASIKAWRMRSGHRNGLVFRSSHSPEDDPTGYSFRDVKRQWSKLMKAADIESFRFHDLRHTFASDLVRDGVNLYLVKELLGHSTIQLTERYSHIRPEELQKAVAVLESERTSSQES